MKIGLFYEDINTGELFMCDNFTYSRYVWINVKGERINEDKREAWKHMSHTSCKDKKKIKAFLENHNYNVWSLCKECEKAFRTRFKRYVNEMACGEELCTECHNKLKKESVPIG